jgi:hypothetical protein
MDVHDVGVIMRRDGDWRGVCRCNHFDSNKLSFRKKNMPISKFYMYYSLVVKEIREDWKKRERGASKSS